MKKKTKILTECAILVALSTVLSFIKVWNMPWGGSVTLFSMLPVCCVSIRHGLKWGLGSSFVYAIIQLFCGITLDGLLGWGLTPGMLVACIVFDYILPFTALGFAGMFSKNGTRGEILGTVMVVVIRFFSHLLSGVYVFASVGRLWQGFETSNTWIYSAVYNSCYMLPELFMTIIGALLVYKALERNKI